MHYAFSLMAERSLRKILSGKQISARAGNWHRLGSRRLGKLRATLHRLYFSLKTYAEKSMKARECLLIDARARAIANRLNER